MKKMIFLNLVFLFLLAGCIIPKNAKESPLIIRHFKIFGNLYREDFQNITKTQNFGFYTNDKELEINDAIFIGKNISKKYDYFQGSSNYNDYKIFFVAIDSNEPYEFDKIELETSRGKFVLNMNLIHRKIPEHLAKGKKFLLYNRSFYYFEDFHVNIPGLGFIDFHLKFGSSERIEFLDIEIFEKSNFPDFLKIKKIYINNVEFKKDAKNYILSANNNHRIDIKLSHYFLGNYNFKITAKINDETVFILSEPIRLDYFSSSGLKESHNIVMEHYWNGNFAIDLEPVSN